MPLGDGPLPSNRMKRPVFLRHLATVLAASSIALAACGDDGAIAPDAGPGDAATDDAPLVPPPLAVSLTGDPVAYLDADACYRAHHTGGPSARITWIWGDDARETIEGTDEACHRFRWPGDVLVSVIVEANIQTASDTLPVAVVPRPSSPPPASSTPIAYDTARDRVWVVAPDASSVAVLEADPPALVREIPVGARPRTLAIAGDIVAVACQDDATLRLIDAVMLEEIGRVTFAPGSAPYGVVADPRGGHLYVSLLESGDLAVVDLSARATVATLPVGSDPRGLAVNARGALLVTRWRSTTDGATVRTIDVTDPTRPALVGETLLPPDVGRDSDTDNDGVLSFLDAIVFSPDGGRAVIPALKANVVAGTFRTGAPLTSQTTARAVLGEVMIDAPAAPALESWRHSFDDLDFASAAVFSPEGSRIYVAAQGGEKVLVLDAFGFDVTGSIDQVGHAPQGLALSPDGTRLFVHAFLSRSVRVYAVGDLTTEPPLLVEVSTVATEPLRADVLRGKVVFHRSRDPRMSLTSYLSCASCHHDGEGDNLVWDFTQRGEGLRNTIPLRGRAGASHGPLHWSANFDEVQDFEHDIRGGQGGAGFLADDVFHGGTRDTTLGDSKAGLDADLDALAAYVTSLGGFGASPYRRAGDPAWEASFARGEAIFASAEAGCASCHAPPRFTDSAFAAPGAPILHDVGTIDEGSGSRLASPLSGLDTPTLRGLWRSAPYLHDGSAATLREVITSRNAADLHGRTSHLSASDADDLVTYLLALDDSE